MRPISYLTSRARAAGVALGLALAAAACTADKDAIIAPTGQPTGPTFASVSAALKTACGSCHAASSGRPFTVAMDSAALVGSGLLNPAAPGTSPLLTKPRSTSHGGGVVSAFSRADSALIAAWVAALPATGTASPTTVTAVRTDFAPTVDGVGDALWIQPAALNVTIGGGWAAATSVSVRAMYDDHYVYFLLRWYDRAASYRRQPWVKRADGTWFVAPAKPAPEDGKDDWASYMQKRGGAAFDPEAPEFMYEDKVALIWNTYAAGTVAGFEEAGCAVTCHDPTKGGAPGTTYNYARGDLAAKKYLTTSGQILDMWHWKMVRNNAQAKADDQYVRYWVPANDASAGNGGRASDDGAAGYRDNPSMGGRPLYKSATWGLLPAAYAFPEADTVRLAQAEVDEMPAGTWVANMLTSPLGGKRADVDAKGVYDKVAQTWTLEIRRRRVTGDDKDVQFDDLARKYKFGIAIFDNAQIEHSISGIPLSLVFKR